MQSRNIRIASAVTFLIILLIIAVTLLISKQQEEKLSKKPSPPNWSEISDEKEGKWYIKFSVKNQKTTAYVEEAYAPKASSGKDYFIGGVAVHPIYAGADPRRPIIPFGTTLYLEEPITVQGQQFSELTVMDTGDIYYGLWSQYPYWIDIYYGTNNYYNTRDASNYGTDLVNYYWIEEWR